MAMSSGSRAASARSTLSEKLTTFNRSFNGTLSISSTSARERKGVFNRCASAVSGTMEFLEIGIDVAEGLITSLLLDELDRLGRQATSPFLRERRHRRRSPSWK